MPCSGVDFHSLEARRNPYPLYEQARTTCPVLYNPQTGYWMVFDYDGVKRVITDTDAFSSDLAGSAGQRTPPWMIFMDPPRHTKLRALVAGAFTPEVVASLERRVKAMVVQLLEPAMQGSAMDFAAEVAIPLPLMVIAEMIGMPGDDWSKLRHWSDVILSLSQTISSREAGAAAGANFRSATAEMNQYLATLIEQRRTCRGNDVLSRLVHSEVDGERLSDHEVLAFVQLLLVAGNETTTNLLNNALLCFADYPAALARLRQTPELLKPAIEEVLRYRSPFQFMFRATRRETQIGGVTIPSGKVALAMIGSANRDQSRFLDPDRFDIARDPNPHLAFGHGIHFCLGSSLSRMEARVVLTEFFKRAERFELVDQNGWQPRAPLHVMGPERLAIRFEPAVIEPIRSSGSYDGHADCEAEAWPGVKLASRHTRRPDWDRTQTTQEK
jgi:cytochrome P450